MSITPIDMSKLRQRIKEVKSLDTVQTFKKVKATTQAAKQLAGIVSPLDLKLANSLANRVKDLEIDAKQQKAPNWFVRQIDKIPWLKKLRLFAVSTLDKTIDFFKNTAKAIDTVLDRVPGWKFVKKLSVKSWQFLEKLVSHPLFQKFLNIFGLIANVFSVFSSFAQWKLVLDMSSRFDKFTSKVVADFNRDFTKLVNQVLPVKKQVDKLNKDLPGISEKIRAFNNVIPQIVKDNARLTNDLKNQNAQIKGLLQGATAAVTAQSLNFAIGKVVERYQLNKLVNNVAPYSSQLPNIAKHTQQINDLQKLPKGMTPQQINQLNGLTADLRNLKNNPVKLSPEQIQRINQVPGLANAVNQLKGTQGLTPAQLAQLRGIGIDVNSLKIDVNGLKNRPINLPSSQLDDIARRTAPLIPKPKDGKDGQNGVNGLTQVIYQYLPGKDGKNGRNGVDATMDPDTKAKINAIFLETQGNKATQQAISAQTTATLTTTVQVQQQVGVIGRTTEAIVNLNQAIDNRLKGFIKWSGLDRVYIVLIAITNLMMIASLLQGTVDLIVNAIETGWSLFGFGLKDAEGNQLSLATAIQGSLRQGLENLLGKETVNDLEVKWVKNNRIYQAASAIAWNVVSIAEQTKTLGEQTLGHVNKIGNALKNSGTVAEDSWVGHWAENPTTGPFGSAVQNLTELSEKVAIAVMPISTVAGIKGETDQLETNKKNLKEALEADDKKISDEIKANKPKVPATLTNMQIGKVEGNG